MLSTSFNILPFWPICKKLTLQVMNWKCNHTSVITLISWIPNNQCKISDILNGMDARFPSNLKDVHQIFPVTFVIVNNYQQRILPTEHPVLEISWKLLVCLWSHPQPILLSSSILQLVQQNLTQNSPLYCFTQLLSVCLTNPILCTDLNVWSQLNPLYARYALRRLRHYRIALKNFMGPNFRGYNGFRKNYSTKIFNTCECGPIPGRPPSPARVPS